MGKARAFKKNIYFCSIDYTKAFDCVGHNKLEISSTDGSTRPHYLSPKKTVYDQKAEVTTRNGTTDWFKTGKGVKRGCTLLT